MKYTPRLRAKYQEEIALKLKSKFEYSSIMQVPKITKICLNQGLVRQPVIRRSSMQQLMR